MKQIGKIAVNENTQNTITKTHTHTLLKIKQTETSYLISIC